MKYVELLEDITRQRRSNTGNRQKVWVKAGIYRFIRHFDENRAIIELEPPDDRIITIVPLALLRFLG